MSIAAVASPAWIETFAGKRFHLLDPQPDEIDILDIAHALSNQCRYTGHTRRFYSVAEHSFHVSLLCPNTRLAGLLHDASEAYLSDISRPLKLFTSVGEPYKEIESRIMEAIAAKFGFLFPFEKEVKIADEIMLWTEKEQLMGNMSWDGLYGPKLDYAMTPLVGWDPTYAKMQFLARFHELMK